MKAVRVSEFGDSSVMKLKGTYLFRNLTVTVREDYALTVRGGSVLPRNLLWRFHLFFGH